jgi:hypothetical protein
MSRFPAKSVEQLQQEYFQSLAAAGTGLRFDTTQGSVIHALARGSAAVAAEQYRQLRTLASSITLSDTFGTDLDTYSAFGVTRRQPSTARGTILAIAPDSPVIIPPGTILLDPQTTLQFETLNSISVNVSYLEVPIQVRSLLTTPLANLAPGTRLYSGNYTSVVFTVGTSRLANGNYTGALTGGAELESDAQYRSRIATWLSSHNTASQSSVVDRLLEFPGVSRAFTVTNSGGVLEIWVDSLSTIFSEPQKAELGRFVKDYVADGIIVSVSQVERVGVDIDIEATPFPNTPSRSLDVLSNRIREVVRSQIQRLEVGQNFSRELVANAIKPLASVCKVKSPGRDILIKNGQLAVLGDLHVTFPV